MQDLERDIILGAIERLGEALDKLEEREGESIAHKANILFYLMSRITKDIPEAVGILSFIVHFLNHLPYDERTFRQLAEKARSLMLEGT